MNSREGTIKLWFAFTLLQVAALQLRVEKFCVRMWLITLHNETVISGYPANCEDIFLINGGAEGIDVSCDCFWIDIEQMFLNVCFWYIKLQLVACPFHHHSQYHHHHY